MCHLVLGIDGHRKSRDGGHVHFLNRIQPALHFINTVGRVAIGEIQHRHQWDDDRNLVEDLLVATGSEKRGDRRAGEIREEAVPNSPPRRPEVGQERRVLLAHRQRDRDSDKRGVDQEVEDSEGRQSRDKQPGRNRKPQWRRGVCNQEERIRGCPQ